MRGRKREVSSEAARRAAQHVAFSLCVQLMLPPRDVRNQIGCDGLASEVARKCLESI